MAIIGAKTSFTGLVAIYFLLASMAAFGDEAPVAKSPPVDQLYWIRVEGKCGYIDGKGKVVIQPQFEQSGEFHDGLAWAVKEDRIFFVDSSGKEAFKCPFTHDYSAYSEGFTRGSIGLKFHFIDTKGKLLPGFFAGAKPFSEGMAAVCVNPARFEESKPTEKTYGRDGKWGFIDSSGKLVIPADYWSVGKFSHGLAPVLIGGKAPDGDIRSIGGKWGYVNKKGDIVIKAQFVGADAFSDGLALVVVEGNKTGYIDLTGKMIIKPRLYFVAFDFHDGVALIREEFNGRGGYIDKQGKITNLKIRVDSEGYSEGLAVCSDKPTWNGTEWIPGPKGYVDKLGEWVIQPQFKSALPFMNGIARVGNDDSYGWIDKSGKFIWPMTK